MPLVRYWVAICRFALLRHLPKRADDVPLWAVCVPYVLWYRAVRHDGRTFLEVYNRGAPEWQKRFLPLRTLYLVFLFLWPLAALMSALMSALRHGWKQLRQSLTRPDLLMEHRHASYSERELRWSRPDFALAMFYAWEFARAPLSHHWLEDKRIFLQRCAQAALPVPRIFTLALAQARGGSFIVKDPHIDLGAGVRYLDIAAIIALPNAAALIIQERLYNHPQLLSVFPDDAPLSTLRVFTALDPVTHEPGVTRCAVRMGRSGSLVDNTARGGIWAQVDPDTGMLLAGVMKKTFGQWREGKPVRYDVHPDTGRSFVGLKVPWMEEGQALALEAHRRLAPQAIGLGWDIALAAERPVLLEVNVWTIGYDYDPPSDARGAACELIIQRLSQAP